MRPIGCSATSCSSSPGTCVAASTIGVSTVPGHTAFTRTPRWPYSSAADFVSPSTPCFDDTYGDCPGYPTRPAPDAVFTIAPPRREQVRELVLHAEVHAAQHHALHAVPLLFGQVADVVLRGGDAGVVVGEVEPTVLRRRSRRPSPAPSRWTRRRSCTNRASAPASARRSTVSAPPAASTSATTTAAPARANASADARPIPAAAPVTTATRPDEVVGDLAHGSGSPVEAVDAACAGAPSRGGRSGTRAGRGRGGRRRRSPPAVASISSISPAHDDVGELAR